MNCLHCYFLRLAKIARLEADSLSAERLACLAGPHYKAALEFERLAEGEPRACVGEPPRATTKSLKDLLRDP